MTTLNDADGCAYVVDSDSVRLMLISDIRKAYTVLCDIQPVATSGEIQPFKAIESDLQAVEMHEDEMSHRIEELAADEIHNDSHHTTRTPGLPDPLELPSALARPHSRTPEDSLRTTYPSAEENGANSLDDTQFLSAYLTIFDSNHAHPAGSSRERFNRWPYVPASVHSSVVSHKVAPVLEDDVGYLSVVDIETCRPEVSVPVCHGHEVVLRTTRPGRLEDHLRVEYREDGTFILRFAA